MAGDPIDDLGAALFSAARRERPADAVRARTIEAMCAPGADAGAEEPDGVAPSDVGPAPVVELARASRFRVAIALAALLAALAAGVVLVRGRSEPAFSIGPEYSSHRDDTRAAPSLPKVEDEPAPAPVAPSTAEKPARPRTPSHASRDASAVKKIDVPPPASLPDEIAALDRARTALSRGDTAVALGVLDDYDRVLHGTRLTAEATLLRVDALARSGRGAEASDMAARFVEANPGSALADRARAFIRSRGSSRVDAGGLQ